MSGIVIRSTKEVLFLSLAIKGPRLSPMIVTERLHNSSHERNLRRRPNLGKRLKRSRRHCLSKLEHLSLFQMVFACAFDKSSMAMRLDSFWTNGFLHCNATYTHLLHGDAVFDCFGATDALLRRSLFIVLAKLASTQSRWRGRQTRKCIEITVRFFAIFHRQPIIGLLP